ncbi:PH domain-containing protein [Candidatus Venteria ishoeyi]|uniref:Bacterial membrane flanked domain protein n=1 Tax=Candidatus Venteria ishoeyi TaxID=1899563 RepID=A0A1H6F9E3_9GAMM|nr:PH domain-containing protein [Candidatus Venteria ishoeyi]SEH05756.1 Bacterial membrane flanked domain protein [Candidatus Venteria ishoeyi]
MGNYVNNHLIDNESIIYEAKLHGIQFFSLKSAKTLWIGAIIDYITAEFVITDKRIIIKVGLIWRNTWEMNLSKIESVIVRQSIMGRILNYGEVTIIGTGGTHESFSNISKPLKFRKKFQEIV